MDNKTQAMMQMLTAQRNAALDNCVAMNGHIAELQAENMLLKQEIEALKTNPAPSNLDEDK